MPISRRRRSSRKTEDKSFWIAYSDLMSSLLLVFVLVLFFSVYQYYEMNDARMAELDVKQDELSLKQAELDDLVIRLSQQEDRLRIQSDELDDKTAQLDDKTTQLEQKDDQLKGQESSLIATQLALELQQAELDALKSRLADQSDELDAARASYASQVASLMNQKSDLEQLLGVRRELVETLVRALEENQITGAKVDATGAIVFESDLLFDVGRSDIKLAGKDFLSSFIPNYLKVLMSEEYQRHVSEIIIEGHTDTTGGYETNMTLSLARADSVLRYIIGEEFDGIGSAQKEMLKKIVHPTGCAFMNPVYGADGEIDMNASRRVVIKFRLNEEDAINNVIELLRRENSP